MLRARLRRYERLDRDSGDKRLPSLSSSSTSSSSGAFWRVTSFPNVLTCPFEAESHENAHDTVATPVLVSSETGTSSDDEEDLDETDQIVSMQLPQILQINDMSVGVDTWLSLAAQAGEFRTPGL